MREVMFGGENKQKIAFLQVMQSCCAVPSSSVSPRDAEQQL